MQFFMCLFVSMSSPPNSVGEGVMFSGGLPFVIILSFIRSFIRSFIFKPADHVAMISHEQLSNCDKTYMGYLLAPTDDLIRFWRSKVKVAAGRRDGEASTLTLVEVHLLVTCTVFISTYCILLP